MQVHADHVVSFVERAERARIAMRAVSVAEAILRVHSISGPISSGRLAANSAAKIVAVALFCAVAIPAPNAWPALASHRQFHRDLQIAGFAFAPRTIIAQADTESDDDKEVPPSQVDKYIDINVAMQKDHNLTVEQAAPKHGMTVEEFRTLEGKIERDDTLRERVRTALRKAADPNAKDSEQ